MRLRIAVWIGIVIAVIAGIVGFQHFRNQAPPVGGNVPVVSFAYSHSGSSRLEFCSYKVTKDAVRYDLFCGLLTGTLPADDNFMQDLSALTDNHNLRKWDGFDKFSSFVMDGSGFELNVSFEDGTGITASGGNSFPEGYDNARSAIDGLFRGYLKKHGIDPEGGY